MKVMVFLAEGFEEVEALTVVDYLRRMDIEVDMVSIYDELDVNGAHGVGVKGDRILEDIGSVDGYDGLVIPGGLPGASNLRDDDRVVEFVREMNSKGGLVAAICAGPIVLERAGIVSGKRLTSYPGFEDELRDSLYIKEGVVVDGNIITARGPNYAVDFALELVDYLLGSNKREELEKDILYREEF